MYLEGDGHVGGGDHGDILGVVVGVEVAENADAAVEGHVVQDDVVEDAADGVDEDVDAVRGGDLQGGADVLRLVVEGPVEAQIHLDPGGFVAVARVPNHLEKKTKVRVFIDLRRQKASRIQRK